MAYARNVYSVHEVYNKELTVDGNLRTSMLVIVIKVAQWSVNLDELHKITSITVFLGNTIIGKLITIIYRYLAQICLDHNRLTLLIVLYLGTLQATIQIGQVAHIVQLDTNKTAARYYNVGHVFHTTLLQEIRCTNIKFLYTSTFNINMSVLEIAVIGRKLSGMCLCFGQSNYYYYILLFMLNYAVEWNNKTLLILSR